MSRRLAVPVLLTACVSGGGAVLTVFVVWGSMLKAPETISPAMWAARSYLAHFDLWALATFAPSVVFCRWMQTRSGAACTSESSPRVHQGERRPFQEVP